MARIARRSLRVPNLPLFSLQHPWHKAANASGELPLNLFEPRYVELARRIEPPKGSREFGYTEVAQRRKAGRGVLVDTDEFQWARSEGPVQLVAKGLRRFRILSLRSESMREGSPLYVAHVQLLADRDLARMPARFFYSEHYHEGHAGSTVLTSMDGEVYVQSGGWGFASYHFDEAGPYISYESALTKTFPQLDDGSRPPAKKYFENMHFNSTTRTFTGTVSWEPGWQGAVRWDYEIVFSCDYNAIVGGGVTWHVKNNGQERYSRFGVNLHYKRLQMGIPGNLVESVASSVAASASSTDMLTNIAQPVQARMRYRRQIRISSRIAKNQNRRDEVRIAAIESLTKLASPPEPVAKAEDALHQLLLDVSKDDAPMVQFAVENALWVCWHQSGNPDVDAEFKRGIALMEKKQLQEAVESFTKVIEMAPKFAEALNKRATVLCALGKYKESIDDCKKVLELKPLHFGCLTGLGMCYRALGQPQSALDWLRTALEVHPGMRGAQALLEQVEVEQLVDTHLKPSMEGIANIYRKGEQVPPKLDGRCTWDVHCIKTGEGKEVHQDNTYAYFFRLRICNAKDNQSAMRSRARFYVLHAADGNVFQFTRPTQGDASFRLEPGEEHKLCFALIVGRELQGASCGALLERLSETDETSKFATEEFPSLLMLGASVVDRAELPRLGQGYTYTGQLDLRNTVGF